MNSDEEAKLTILKRYIENMPTFSPATKKVIELANDINAEPKEIIKAVRMDPVLTGKIFELINSAYFGLDERVTSLNRCVVYLGINTVKNVALSTAVVEALSSESNEIEALVRPVWKHSLSVAVCCKTIAKAIDVPKNLHEEYFIAGLLHDIGKIVLIQCFHKQISYDDKMSLEQEKKNFGLSHSEVGYVILKKWKFDDHLKNAIKNHHHPSSDERLLYCVHLADYLTYELGLTPEETIASQSIVEDTWSKLNTNEETIKRSLVSVKEEIEKAEVFLKS